METQVKVWQRAGAVLIQLPTGESVELSLAAARLLADDLERALKSSAPTPQLRWSEDRKAELRRLYAEGRRIKEIAAHFNTSPGNISVNLKRFGISRRPRLALAPRRAS